MPKKNVKVIKVPNNSERINLPQIFPRMPRLYLELIENKDKIHQKLVNKDYEPNSATNIQIPDFNEKQDAETINPVENLQSPTSNVSDLSSDKDESIKSRDLLKEEASDNESVKSYSSRSTASDVLSARLKELLDEDSRSDLSTPPRKKKKHKHHSHHKPSYASPPTLKELEYAGAIKREKHLPDLEREPEQDEEDLKRELLFKFELLKKSYKDAQIPEFSIHSNYKHMNNAYEDTVRRLSIDSTVDSYKTYLIGGFMATEFILGKFLKFDMQGFTNQQMMNIQSYDKLLIELGEKSYVPEGSDWPIEIRLLFLIVVNAAFFIVGKMLMKRTGSNIFSMMSSMNSKPAAQNKRKMRGPEINVDDLPDDD